MTELDFEKERVAFEVWAKQSEMNLDRFHNAGIHGNNYLQPLTRYAWGAWCARAAQNLPPD